MNEQPVIKRLTDADLDDWKEIRRTALIAAPTGFGRTLASFSALSDADHGRRLGGSVVLGAYLGGGIVGSGAWYQIDFPTENHRAKISSFFVRPAFQGRGVADMLMDRIVDDTRGSLLQLELDVAVGNERAVSFYRRHGFMIVGTLPRALCYDGQFTDEHLMVHRLDA